jgi:hypothetical protein
MTVARLTCPDCKAVLKPARPVPVGKKVKCPRCGTTFAAAEDEASDAAEAPTMHVPKKTAPGKKPEAAKPTASKPAKPSDDDDGPATYSVTLDPDDEPAEPAKPGKPAAPKKKKPEISQVPDMSVKDLRGPAQAAVVSPTNALLISGLAGFIGWLALLVLLLIPALFPLDSDETDKNKPRQALRIPRGLSTIKFPLSLPGATGTTKDKEKEKKDEESGRSFLYVMGYDLADIAGYDLMTFFVYVLPILFGMIYAGIVAFGAVKVQNLESRNWGFVSSIMGMLPINAGGLIIVVLIGMERILEMIYYDDPGTMHAYQIGVAVLICLGELGAGAWMVMTLLREDVVEGFEYKAE